MAIDNADKHYFFIIIVGANYLEGTIKTVWIGPMTQSEDINQSKDGQIRL